MEVQERRSGEVTILDLRGRLVLEDGVDILRERVNRLLADGRRHLLVNLRDITYIDSCGVGVLIAKFLSARRAGGDLRLLHLTDRSHHLMEITRLRDVFPIYESEDEAIRSFATAPGPADTWH
ncbi:MAG TPA: STAS domain-containing protein [Vicinamibacterales bacterium]|nr:STAS domain-containing protein [Vicinamibacterales bacterium]